MNCVIIGGGNSTPIISVLLKNAGNKVSILTRKPELWDYNISFINNDKKWLPSNEYNNTLDYITSDYNIITEAEFIFFAGLPVHINEEIIIKIKPFLNKNKHYYIGTICAYGCLNWIIKEHLNDYNITVFGTQLIPWCCGTIKYGKTSIVYGAKKILRIALEKNDNNNNNIMIFLKNVLKQELQVTDFISSLFWPNNPWLHPPILYGLLKDWDGLSTLKIKDYPNKIYGEMTEYSGEIVSNLNDEICNIVNELSKNSNNNNLNLNYSLHYNIILNYGDDVIDNSTLYTSIRTCNAFSNHILPFKHINENEMLPDVNHKFFQSDLSYGLIPYKDIALMLNIKTPLLDKIIYWNQFLINKKYLINNELIGDDIKECIYPTKYKIKLQDL